jgi:endonuclease V-like protein UPF0215 family
MIKPGVRSMGIDDGPFDRSKKGDVLVVGAVYQGGNLFDGLLTTKVRRDGWNATDRLLSMLKGSKFKAQLHYIILDGIAFGGFNVADIERLHKETGLKILVAVRKRPDMAAVKRAVNRLSRPEARWSLIEKAGEIQRIGQLYCQLKGMNAPEAEELLALTCTRSLLPEPLRAAHLIAGGIVRGQSGRRA